MKNSSNITNTVKNNALNDWNFYHLLLKIISLVKFLSIWQLILLIALIPNWSNEPFLFFLLLSISQEFSPLFDVIDLYFHYQTYLFLGSLFLILFIVTQVILLFSSFRENEPEKGRPNKNKFPWSR